MDSLTGDTSKGERPIARIVEDILSHLGEILRSEFRLVRMELQEDLREVRSVGVYVGIGGVLALFGFGFLMLGVVYALSLVLPAWQAAVSVGLALVIVGVGVAAAGRSKLRNANLKPKRTIQTMEDNVRWFRTRTK